MNWKERILNSDAGRGNREVAERMVREGEEKTPRNQPSSLDEVDAEVLKGEYS